MQTALSTTRRLQPSRATRRFARHYLEMVAAMFAGMFVLGGAILAVLAVAGVGRAELKADAPAAFLLGMALTMTVPMVAWMRHRGHGWLPSAEMSAAMIVPTLGTVALLAAGTVTDMGGLMTIQHVVMFPAMLAVMLLRPAEYTGHVHGTR